MIVRGVTVERQGLHRHAALARQMPFVGAQSVAGHRAEFGANDSAHQVAGDHDLLRIQAARRHDLVDFDEHLTAGVACGHRRVQRAQRESLAFERDVAAPVGTRSAKQGHVDARRRVEQVLAAAERLEAGQIGRRAPIHSAAAVPRIDEGVQPDLRQHALLAAGRGAHHRRQRAHRDVVGLQLVGKDRGVELVRRCAAEAGTDHPREQSALRQAVEARARHAVPSTGRLDHHRVVQRELAR